jgi:hypothetical protein
MKRIIKKDIDLIWMYRILQKMSEPIHSIGSVDTVFKDSYPKDPYFIGRFGEVIDYLKVVVLVCA